jgi:hypothetical protein
MMIKPFVAIIMNSVPYFVFILVALVVILVEIVNEESKILPSIWKTRSLQQIKMS